MSDTFNSNYGPSYQAGVVECLPLTQVLDGGDPDDPIEVHFLYGQDFYTAYADPQEWNLRDLEQCISQDLLFFKNGDVLPMSLQPEGIKQEIKDMNEFTSRYNKHRKKLDDNVLISLIHESRVKLANWIRPEFG